MAVKLSDTTVTLELDFVPSTQFDPLITNNNNSLLMIVHATASYLI
jgi:hypothetical protein